MLNICEIKKSLNGEINLYHQGSPAIFVRFQGCNFHKIPCFYCDSLYAVKPNIKHVMESSILAAQIKKIKNDSSVIVFTGGEPLLQDTNSLFDLFTILKNNKIVIETNGSYSPGAIKKLFPYISFVMDYKLKTVQTQNSQMDIMNHLCLDSRDFIKFPVVNDNDLVSASKIRSKIIANLRRDSPCFAVSPIFQREEEGYEYNKLLIEKATERGFTLSVQLHKLLNVY